VSRKLDRDTFVIKRIGEERSQGHPIRIDLYEKLERKLGFPVVAFATSFTYPVMMTSGDAEMLEGILREADLSNGLALLLSSPGGELMAADRIVRICKSYSKTSEYQVLVPGKAKSAATLVSFGSSKIGMSVTSELGPVDPQVVFEEDGKIKVFSLHTLIDSYDRLFEKAVQSKGNIEPYLQQLSHYDEREIAQMRYSYELMEEIAVTTLKAGMMADRKKSEIKKAIQIFLTPEISKAHERPIRAEEAKSCGLNIELHDLHDPIWSLIYELGTRLDYCVSHDGVAKCIESKNHSFISRFNYEEDEE
jgi:ClpP class serine protease